VASCWIFYMNYTMMHGSTNIMLELSCGWPFFDYHFYTHVCITSLAVTL